MLTLKRALVLAGLVLFIFYYTSPRRNINADAIPSSSLSGVRGGARPSLDEAQHEQLTADTLPSGQPTSASSSADKPKKVSESKTQSDAPSTQLINNRRKSQVTLKNMRNEPLRDQLAYQFPYDVSAKFPAFIWQTWKYTPANRKFGEVFRGPEASWGEKHPDFIHEIITDQVALHLIRHLYSSIPLVMEAYTSLPHAIYKADFFRYLILLARGGIYSDIDTEALKPATSWIPYNFRLNQVGLVIGIEADPDRLDWADWYSRRIQFVQWTIQSKPGHPVLREIVAHITEETLRRKKAGKLKMDQKEVVEFTGPAIWTDLIFHYFNNPAYFDITPTSGNISYLNFTHMQYPKKIGDVVVLPITSFSPGIGHSGAGEVDDPLAFVKHDFEGTWKPDSERHIGIITE